MTLFALLGIVMLDPQRAISQYMLEVWDSSHGLPQNSINSLIQCQKGFIWAATQEGVVRFDGVNFEIFNKNNVDQIKSSFIGMVLEDRDGSIWVGTELGRMLIYDDGTWRLLDGETGWKYG